MILATDLEGTIIRDNREPIPRPGLYDFLTFCHANFDQIVMFTTVHESKFREIAEGLIAAGEAPGWFQHIEYISKVGEYKDLRQIPDADLQDVLLLDDYEGYVDPAQKGQWIPIETFFEQENDRELDRVTKIFCDQMGVRNENRGS